MAEHSSSSLDEFKHICRTELQYLVTDFGFRESPEAADQSSNPVRMQFVRDDLTVTVEGIQYGTAALMVLQDKRDRLLSVNQLTSQSDPLNRRSAKSKHHRSNQTEDIQRNAKLLKEYGTELLSGDFAVFERAIARLETANIEYQRRRELGIADQKAVAAFRQEEWQEVVELLEPREATLSKAMAKRLTLARSRL